MAIETTLRVQSERARDRFPGRIATSLFLLFFLPFLFTACLNGATK
jgi:hypothetical protein